jgi:hypothetical protein
MEEKLLNDETKLEIEDQLSKATLVLEEAEANAALAREALQDAEARANETWEYITALRLLLEREPEELSGDTIKTFGDE